METKSLPALHLLVLLQEKLAEAQDDLQKQRHWNDIQVTVNLDKLQEAKDNFASHQIEATAAMHDRDKVIERLKAELKSLSHQLETKTADFVSCRRQASVLESKLRDQCVFIEVKHS